MILICTVLPKSIGSLQFLLKLFICFIFVAILPVFFVFSRTLFKSGQESLSSYYGLFIETQM